MVYNQFGASPYMQAPSMYNAPQYDQIPQIPRAVLGINWVQGEAGAKGFQLPTGAQAILMDQEDSVFYIKSTDNVGMPAMRKYRFEEIVEVGGTSGNSAAAPAGDFVTREEFEAVQRKIAMYETMIQNFMGGKQYEPDNATVQK